jgi:hypothetical protein
MICEYVLKDGRRLGTRRVTSIDTAFADDLFEKLLHKDVDGEKVERRTTVNHAIRKIAPYLQGPFRLFAAFRAIEINREFPGVGT